MKPVKTLTKYQEEFIAENYKTMTDKKIAKEIGLTQPWVLLYRQRNGMIKQIQRHGKIVQMKDDDNEVFFNVNKRTVWL